MHSLLKLGKIFRHIKFADYNQILIRDFRKDFRKSKFTYLELNSNLGYINRWKSLLRLGLAAGLVVGISYGYKKNIHVQSSLLKQCSVFCYFPSGLPCVEAASPAGTSSGNGSLRTQFNFIADVVEKTAYSVVCIELKDTKRRDLFTGQLPTRSNGSGFIVSEDGLILTNAHVILGRPNAVIQVKLHDGSIYRGYVGEVDARSDLATIHIKANKKLPSMKLGSSSELRPGEWVVAIGSPLSLNNSITAGVISSVHRKSDDIGLLDRNMEYIQTDASITFGNSGGPLVNLDGEAIGINVMRLVPGISFAIPIDHVKEFLEKAKLEVDDPPLLIGTYDKWRSKVDKFLDFVLKTNQNVQTHLDSNNNPAIQNKSRYLGITMVTLSGNIVQEFMTKYGIKFPDKGVIVWRVVVGSPADNAGVKPGDVVTHINGKPITSASDVNKFLEKSPIIKMAIIRQNSNSVTITVEAEEI